MPRIAILSGGGQLPLVLADSIAQRGGRAHIVAVRGEAGPQIEAYPHTWVTWGGLNGILAALKRESDGTMMIAGSVSRPDLMRLKPDFGVIRHLPKVLAMLRGGDDAVLTRLIRFFEAQGLIVKGVAEVAPELLAGAGRLGAGLPPSTEVEDDIARGFAVLDAVADLDVGQAVAVEHGRVLAIEGVEGTDRMLTRVAEMADRQTGGGVLVKGPKRGQELRVDMPTVGARTVGGLQEARLATLVVVAGKTLLLERDAMIQRAAASHVTIDARPHESLTPANRAQSQTTGRLPEYRGRLLGRIAPATANAHDARVAAEVTRRLAAFDTGRAAVVVRDHVLAIAAAEGHLAMVRRTAALRQWGHGRFLRAAGAAAVRFDPARDDAGELSETIEVLATAGIAGLALLTPTNAGDVPQGVVGAADRCGMFLVDLADPGASHTLEAV